MSPHISIDRDAVSAFCRRHHITRLALFGSVLRDDFGPDSDVDVLVEFQAGHVPGFNFVSIEREFSGLLHGRRVDMVTPKVSQSTHSRSGLEQRRATFCRRVTSYMWAHRVRPQQRMARRRIDAAAVVIDKAH